MSSTTFYNSQNLVGIGSVGIGTTNPKSPLHVNAAVGGAGIVIGPTVPYTSSSGQFSLAVLNDGLASGQYNSIQIGKSGYNSLFFQYNYTGTAATDYTSFTPYGSTAGTSLVVQGSGNVGIGTPNPVCKLDIAGGPIKTYTGSDVARIIMGPSPSGTNLDYCSLIESISSTVTNYASILKFYTHGTASTTSDPTLAMTINSSQQVGIGTPSPSAPLTVASLSGASNPTNNGILVYNQNNSSTNNAIITVRIAGASASSAYYSYDVQSVNGYSHGILGSSQNLVFRASYDFSTTTLFTMDRSGNFTATADITAFSDRRIKTDIKRIEGALDKVSQIGGYTFTRTDEVSKGQRQAGVIAQELLEVLPEVVRVNEETGYYTVSYGNITALLIEALKEEKNKRESLEARIAALELTRPII